MTEQIIHGIKYETVYDTENEISIPMPCADTEPTVNNINLSALKYIISKNPNNLWGESSLNDFKDFLENPPKDKIFVGVGEIILSPQNNPEQYYLFLQNKNGSKTYLTVEKLESAKKKKKQARKQKVVTPDPQVESPPKPQETPKKQRKTQKQPEEPQQSLIPDIPVKPRKKRETQPEEIEPINAECFFLMKIAEAMEEYCKLTFPADLKKYKKLTK